MIWYIVQIEWISKKQGFRTRGYDYDPLASLALLCPDFLGWGSQGPVR